VSSAQLDLYVELLNAKANLKLLHVPYPGGAAATTDAISGQVNMVYALLPRDCVSRCGRTSLVRHVQELEVGLGIEQLHIQVQLCAGHCQLAWCGFGRRQHFGTGVKWRLGVGCNDKCNTRHQADWLKGRQLERRLGSKDRVEHLAVVRKQECVAISLGPGNGLGGDVGATAWAVIDDDGLAQLCGGRYFRLQGTGL
jgi:hypothetical protein